MNILLVNTHSIFRWIVLILLVYAIINSISGKKSYGKKDKILNLFAMVALHVQLLLGIILYLTSSKVSFTAGWMKVDYFRFFGMEHLLGMLAAITVVTVGRSMAEKQHEAIEKHKKIRMWYLIGLILIIAFIPWPFREGLGGKWF